MSSRRKFIVVFVLATILGCSKDADDTNSAKSAPLPELKDIRKIAVAGEGFEVMSGSYDVRRTVIYKAIPQKDWESLLGSFRPNRRLPGMPRKAYGPGSVIVTLSDGSKVEIGILVNTDTDEMTFGIDDGSIWYEGGNKRTFYGIIKSDPGLGK